MTNSRSRRNFLKASFGAATTAQLAFSGPGPASPPVPAGEPRPGPLRIRKAAQISMLSDKLSYADRFKLAQDAGFDGVEARTVEDPKNAEELHDAAQSAKLPIHSVMNMAHWKYPLSSPEPEVVKISIDGMKTSLHNAKLWGAEAVLLVPAVVNAEVSYHEAWTRSQKNIRTLIPLAEELKVIIAIEEVWNKFLLSPLEMVKYVDEFHSPWVKSYFDVGNVVLYGYPQDWIRTLGNRFVKVHLKDFKILPPESGVMQSQWVNLGGGDINWPAVHQAFADVGYTGWVTTELPGGDADYLSDVAKRVDKLVLGV